MPERVAYSVAEAAFITGLSRDLLYDQMRAGKLPYLKVGSPSHHHPPELEAFLTGQRREPGIPVVLRAAAPAK
jgi:hypothetical protein